MRIISASRNGCLNLLEVVLNIEYSVVPYNTYGVERENITSSIFLERIANKRRKRS
jgi:hypothetical protein